MSITTDPPVPSHPQLEERKRREERRGGEGRGWVEAKGQRVRPKEGSGRVSGRVSGIINNNKNSKSGRHRKKIVGSVYIRDKIMKVHYRAVTAAHTQ